MNIKTVFTNSAVNLLYQVFPALCAIIMVPLTIKWFGSEIFAVFSLAISFIVLFNYLNFGIAQSTNRELAKEYSNSNIVESNKIIGSGLIALLSVGLLISVMGWAFSDNLAFKLSSDNLELLDVTSSMIGDVLLYSPLFLLVIFLRAILEAKLLFKYTAANRALLNSIIFLSPALCWWLDLPIEYSIYLIILVHCISVVFLTLVICKHFEGLTFQFSFVTFWRIVTAGGWMTLISFASVGLLYTDKFIIGSFLGLALLAYYVAAYDLISRSSIIYGSITSAFFPAFSYWYKNGDLELLRNSTAFLYDIMFGVMGIVLGLVIAFSPNILELWIGTEYRDHSSEILQILCLGILASAVGSVPLRLLTASGYERNIALFYIIQSLIYIAMSFFIVEKCGILGVSILFSTRCVIELIVLTLIANRKVLKCNFLSVKNLRLKLLVSLWLVSAFYLSGTELWQKAIVSVLFVSLLFFLYYRKVSGVNGIRALLAKG